MTNVPGPGLALNTVITLSSVISMASAGLLGDAMGICLFFLSGAVTAFVGLLAAVLMRTPAAALPPAIEACPPAD